MTTIHLQISHRITDCEERVQRYCTDPRDPSYYKYDCADVPADDELRKEDIQVANLMRARMSAEVIAKILARNDSIESRLIRIPKESMLERELPTKELKELFDSILMPNVRMARATKILHKKRPELIPILDSVIQEYARQVRSKNPDGSHPRSQAELATEYCQILKRDVDDNRHSLKAVRENLKQKGIHLSELRILDILIWSTRKSWSAL